MQTVSRVTADLRAEFEATLAHGPTSPLLMEVQRLKVKPRTIAKWLGVSRTLVTLMSQGKRVCSLQMERRLASLLRVTIETWRATCCAVEQGPITRPETPVRVAQVRRLMNEAERTLLTFIKEEDERLKNERGN